MMLLLIILILVIAAAGGFLGTLLEVAGWLIVAMILLGALLGWWLWTMVKNRFGARGS